MKRLSAIFAALCCLAFARPARAVETPTGVYFDEVGVTTIVASGYVATPGFTGLETGLAGVNVAKDGVYSTWRNGNVWATKAAMPTARTFVSAATVGGKIYVVGGNNTNGTNVLNVNEEYDPAANSWATKATMPTARTNYSLSVVNGKLYAIGGAGSGMLTSNEEYDPVANAWATKASMPTARFAQSAGVGNGKIYVVGGWTGTALAVNEEYDPVNNSWATKAAMPTARASFSIAVLGGRLYAMGGHGVNISTLPASVEEYNPVSNSWTAKASIPTPRAYLVTGAVSGKIYAVAGGNSVNIATNEEFDPAANTWATKAPLPTLRSSSAGAIANGKFYVFGGWTGSGTPELTANEVYDPGTAFVFGGLNPNVQYSFKAKARDSAGTETSESVTVSTYTLALQPASVVSTFSSVAQYSFAVSWSANGNPAGTLYRVQASPSSSFATVVSSDTYNVTATISGLAAGTPYYVRVAAINGSGAITSYLSLGSISTTGTPASAVVPTGIYFDEISSRSITASAYAATPAFSGLETGSAGINVARDGSYAGWRNGNVWAAKAAMPTARNSMATGVIGGKLYVAGGYTGASVVAVNEEYDQVSNSWSTKAAMPTARYHATSGVVGEKLYVIGGSNPTLLNVNEEYDPIANAWVTKTAMPTTRDQLSSGVIGGKLYVIGGYSGGTPLSTNEEYDPVSNTWITRAGMPSARYQLSAGVLGGKIYVLGGINGSNILNTNQEYSPETNAWVSKAAMPTTRYAFAVGAIGGKLYAIGGYNSLTGGSPNLDVNEEYDPAANAWATRAVMTTARREVAAGVIKGKIYLVGGYNGSAVTTNEEYDPGVAASFTGLTPNTRYTFKAKARDSAGIETAEGPLVSTYTLAAIPAAASPAFTGVNGGNLTANWVANGNPSATRYRAQISVVAAFTVISASSDTYNLSATFTGLSAGATYYARVSAINNDGIVTGYATLGSTITVGVAGNTAPSLLWTGEAGYVSDGVSPETGASTTTFVYRVQYLDVENDAPAAGYPKLHIKKAGVEIAGSPFNMTYVSGAYNAGAIYTFSKVLSVTGSDYAYYFEAQDSNGSAATGAPTSEVDAPDVGDVLSAPQQGGYKTVLGNNLFNPRLGGTAKIKFNLAEAGHVALKIYDLSGRLMRNLYEGTAAAGDTQKDWNGKDDSGLYVVPGVYFLHYEYPGGTEVRKIGVKK